MTTYLFFAIKPQSSRFAFSLVFSSLSYHLLCADQVNSVSLTFSHFKNAKNVKNERDQKTATFLVFLLLFFDRKLGIVYAMHRCLG